MNLIADGVQG